MAKPARRNLDLRSGQQVIDEIDKLRRQGYERAGNWSLTQICDHLEKSIRAEMHGVGYRLPWIFRATIGRYVVNRILKTRRQPRFPAPNMVVPDRRDAEVDDEATIMSCQERLREVTAFHGSLERFPFADGITPDMLRELTWIHSSHHLSFLVPTEPGTN